jgi:hypothetical protein
MPSAPESGATPSVPDPRAVLDYRIPAVQLRPGDLVNTAPGEDDWQEVLSVHATAGSATGELRDLVEAVQGRYVVVELTDLTPVDYSVFFVDGTAMVTTEDGDVPVSELVSGEDGVRTYLFTRFELVTVRPRPA